MRSTEAALEKIMAEDKRKFKELRVHIEVMAKDKKEVKSVEVIKLVKVIKEITTKVHSSKMKI